MEGFVMHRFAIGVKTKAYDNVQERAQERALKVILTS